MDSQHEGRCNCKSDYSRLPTPQFPLIDQLNFNPSSQDPSSSSPAPYPAPTGRDKVPELTREVFNQDLIMVSYFSGTRHLSHGLLDWMKLYVRLQSWNLGNEDALTPDDLAIVENSGLIPILPTLRKKPRSERDGLASQPGSINQPLQLHNYRRAEASTAPLLLSDCNNPPAKLQCVPKTAATLATTDITATTTKASYPALIPTSLVPLKEMTLSLIMSLANAENSAQKAAKTEPESETAFTAEQTPEPATKHAPFSTWAQDLEHAPLDENWKLTKEKIYHDADMSIHRLRAIKPIIAEPDSIAEMKPEPTIKPVPIPESVHALEVTPVTISESTQKLEIAPINNNSNLPKKEATTLSITDVLYKLHAQKPDTVEPVFSAKTIPEAITITECAPILHTTKKLTIDTKWKPSQKEMNEVDKISVPEFINRLQFYKPVTDKTKLEPSTVRASVSESDLIIENASINTTYKLLKKKIRKAIKRDNAPKWWHSDSKRTHHAVCSPLEDKITASEVLYTLIPHMSATKAETKPKPTTKCAYVSENTFQLDPTPIDTKKKHLDEEEINKTDKISTSEFINRLSAQTSATAEPATKTKTTTEFTTKGASVSESALKIEPAPIDTEGKLSKEEMNKVTITQNGEAPPSAAKRRRKKDKITESEFIHRLIAHMSATKAETKPEPTTKCAHVSENTLQLDPTPIDTKQKHWNEEEINKTEKISTSEFISSLSAQTSATEKHATKTKTTPEFTIEVAPVSESALKIETAPIDTEGKVSKGEMNKMMDAQNAEAPPSAAKRRRKKDKITESEFIYKLIAHMSATKAETKPEPTTKCVYVSENTLQLDHTLIDTKQKYWNEEEINKTEKTSTSEFINRLSAQTSATEKHATKTKTTPEFTIEDAPVSESALKIEPATIDTEGKLSKEEINKVIITQNGEVPPPAAKRRRKKEKFMESEFINRLIAHMSATKAGTKPEPTNNCAYVSENTLQLDHTPIDTKQKHWDEEEINKTKEISTSEFINRLSAQISATEKHATKTKTTPEFTIEDAPVSESALKIEPAPIDTEGKLSKGETNKVIDTQNAEAPPSAAKRRRKKEKIMESEFIYKLIAHISTTKADTKPEPTTKCAYVSENTLQLDHTAIDTKQKHWDEEEINKTKEISTSEFINRLSAQTSATEKHATKTKTTTEFTIEDAPVSESALKIEPAPIDTEGKLSKEEMNKVIITQNGEAPPSAAKRRRKKEKLMESEFINRLIAHMSATKAETKPEPTNNCAYVSENTLQLDHTPIDTKQKHWDEEEINKTKEISTSEFINRLSAQTSATEKHATKTKTTPEFTIEDAPVSESALKIEPAPMDTEGKLSKEEMNKVINTQNGEAPPSAAKRRRKKEKFMESEFINRLIAHMSAAKAETKPEPTNNCAYVSENTLQLDHTPIDTKQKHWDEEEINKTKEISTSEFINRLSAQTSATEKPATKTKTTPEFTTEGTLLPESAIKIEPAPIDTKGSTVPKEEMNKVITTQNGEEPPSAAKRRPFTSARRRKKNKITESEFIYRLNAHIISKTKAETKPEPTAKNNADLQNAQTFQATPPYKNTKLLNEEAISETVVMSTTGSCNRIHANMPEARETKPEHEIERAPVLESMQNVEPSSVKRKRSKKRKRSNKDRSTLEIRAAPASPSPSPSPSSPSPSPASDTYSTRFEKVRLTYYDYFNFLEHEFDKIIQTDHDC